MRNTSVGVIIIILVATLNLIPVSNPHNSRLTSSIHENHHLPSIQGSIDEILLEDNFENGTFGFNDSLWNLETYGSSTISWIDSNSLGLTSEVFTGASLESFSDFGPEVIADFEFSFTQGLCYFGIGWVDYYDEYGEEWVTNLRACQNGVFIDYLDTELFLVSYENGNRVSTPIGNHDTTVMHTYSLVWSSSLVSLSIDNVETARISNHIPTESMRFILAISGHHYRIVKSDTLCIDRVTIGTLETTLVNDVPQVTLNWPANNSQVYDFDIIDLEIVSQGSTSYSWNEQMNFSLHSPWDIVVPYLEGIYRLDIYSENATGHSTHRMYMFEVITENTSIPVWNSFAKPVIDGEISTQELNLMTSHNVTFRGEDKQQISIEMLIGYYDQSLYVGVITPIPDRWYSRVSLLIDGSGDGIWGDAKVGIHKDIRITVSGPTEPNDFRGIYSYTGHEIQVSGVTYAVTAGSKGLIVEFFVPVESVGGNFTKGLGYGIIASRGGYNTFYPASIADGGYCILQIAQSLGLRPQDTSGYLGPSIIVIVFTSLIVGVIFTFRKRSVLTIEESLESESLERIRTILQSHPKISIERLALLADTDAQNARESIVQLQRRGLLEDSIMISDIEIIRKDQSSEKKHM